MGLSQDPFHGEQLILPGPGGAVPFAEFVIGFGTFGIYANNGSPEGVVTAQTGSLCLDISGGLWFKQSGSSSTGWAQVNGAAAPTVNAAVALSAARPQSLTKQGAPSAVTAVPNTTPSVTSLPNPASDPLSVVGQYIVIPNATPGIAGIGYYFRAPLTGSGPGYWFQDTTQSPTISDTHANRASHAASSYAVGTVYYETDTKVSYCVQIPSPSNVKTWLYYNGIAEDVLANIPGSLGVDDIGYLFRASDYLHNWMWTGAAWSLNAAAQAGFQGGSFPGTTLYFPGGSPPFGGSGAIWHACDGTTQPMSQENATVVNTVLPTTANTWIVL